MFTVDQRWQKNMNSIAGAIQASSSRTVKAMGLNAKDRSLDALNKYIDKARQRMCPRYIAGLIGPDERKSIQPMAERLRCMPRALTRNQIRFTVRSLRGPGPALFGQSGTLTRHSRCEVFNNSPHVCGLRGRMATLPADPKR
jgi:hypothetical protein